MKILLCFLLLLFFVNAKDNTSLVAHIDQEIAELNKELLKTKNKEKALQKQKDLLFESYKKYLKTREEDDSELKNAREQLFKVILWHDEAVSKMGILEFEIHSLKKKKNSLVDKSDGLERIPLDLFTIKKIEKESAERDASILSSKFISKFGTLNIKNVLLGDAFVQIESEFFYQLNKKDPSFEDTKWDFSVKDEIIEKSGQSLEFKVVPFLHAE